MNQLEALLSNAYTAEIRGRRAAAVDDLRVAIQSDADTAVAAQQRLKELDELVTARGELACSYSTKYRSYLREALE